jgi:hypothetical protein
MRTAMVFNGFGELTLVQQPEAHMDKGKWQNSMQQLQIIVIAQQVALLGLGDLADLEELVLQMDLPRTAWDIYMLHRQQSLSVRNLMMVSG